MNKKKLSILIGMKLAIVAIYFLTASAFAENGNQYDKPSQLCFPFPQRIHTIAVPLEYEFAGQVFCLRRHDLRERFDRELMAFTYLHSTTLLSIKRANRDFPIIERVLRENNVPEDFKYLAVIESHLNPRAVSPMRAVGVWQILEATARELGLTVNDEIDERLHLELSTAAAARFLRQSYEIYGCWLTAAASYNAGRRRISEALADQRQNNILDVFVNDETSRYVFRLMAIKEIMSNPAKYGIYLHREDFYHTVRTREIEVRTSISNWADWAIAHGSTYAQLRYFNPWIRRGKVLHNPRGRTFIIQLPYEEDLNFDPAKIHIHNEMWLAPSERRQ